MDSLASELYSKGYSGVDLISIFETLDHTAWNMTYTKKYHLLIMFQQIKREFRHEELYMLVLLNYMLIRFDEPLENIAIM